jgi:hypothetical protein
MMISVFFIHRLVTYVPTYSGASYGEFNLFNGLLLFLVVMLSVQTRAGQKVNILMDRIVDYYEGAPATKKDAKEPPQPSQSQPIMQQAQQFLPPMPMPMATNPMSMAPPPPPSSMAPPPPQFDAMYERNIEPFGGATSGGLGFSFL